MDNRSGTAIFSILLGSAIIATLSFCGNARAEVILLQNGAVIEGRILEKADYWRIAVESGEVYVRPSDIDEVAPNLDEVYRRRAARITPGDAESHLRLAIWCARYRLIEQGRRELTIAKAMAPDHPLVANAETQLEAAASLLESGATTAEAEESTAPVPPTLRGAKTSQQELAELMETLPKDAAIQFSRTVQPILANSCAVSGCHGTGAPENLRLHPLRHGILAPRETLNNLRRALGWIDYRTPGASPLLVVPSQPHGGLPAPVFSGRRLAQYRELLSWVEAVTQRPTQEETAPTPLVNDVPPLRLDEVPTASSVPATKSPVGDDEGFDELEAIYRELGGSVPEASLQNDSAAPSGVVPAAAMQSPAPSFQAIFQRPEASPGVSSPTGVLPGNSNLRNDAGNEHATPGAIRDPFDPAIFNRKYHPQESDNQGKREQP